MLTANIIKRNQEQTIQLPHDVAFPEYIKQVEVIVVGNTRILTPWANAGACGRSSHLG